MPSKLDFLLYSCRKTQIGTLVIYVSCEMALYVATLSIDLLIETNLPFHLSLHLSMDIIFYNLSPCIIYSVLYIDKVYIDRLSA